MLEEACARIDRANPRETADALERGAIVIDLRCDSSRAATGVIAGSIAIPWSVLEWRCDSNGEWSDARVARPDERVILVCEHGYSSSLAADNLRRLGFTRAGDLVGGIEAWEAQRSPLTGHEEQARG